MDNFQANELMRALGHIDKTLGGIRDALRSLAPQQIGVDIGFDTAPDPAAIAAEFEKIIAAQKQEPDLLADLLGQLEDKPSFRNALKAIVDGAMAASTKIAEELATPTDPPAMPFGDWWKSLTEGFVKGFEGTQPPEPVRPSIPEGRIRRARAAREAAERRNETGIDPETRND